MAYSNGSDYRQPTENSIGYPNTNMAYTNTAYSSTPTSNKSTSPNTASAYSAYPNASGYYQPAASSGYGASGRAEITDTPYREMDGEYEGEHTAKGAYYY
jgi:hypothetical protein